VLQASVGEKGIQCDYFLMHNTIARQYGFSCISSNSVESRKMPKDSRPHLDHLSNISESMLLPHGSFRMIRGGDSADHGTFQKATRETIEKYGF
jgi:hypothetical protein